GHPEYSPTLAGNHFLADVVGLLYCGGALRTSRVGRAWLRVATRLLERELVRQFYEDGVNFEASTCYHRLSTELAFLGLLAMRRLGVAVTDNACARFELAVEALDWLTAPSGRMPAIGDDDSSIVLNLASRRNPRRSADLVGASRALLHGTDPHRPPDEFQQWSVGS